MQRSSSTVALFSVITLLNVSVFASIGAALPTFDTQGTYNISCPANFFLSAHSFSKEMGGTSTFTFTGGSCNISTSDSASNQNYNFVAKWNENSKQAVETIDFTGPETGLIVSNCPADPWLNDVICTASVVNTAGYPLSPNNRFPISAGVFNAAQKALFKAEAARVRRGPIGPILTPRPTIAHPF